MQRYTTQNQSKLLVKPPVAPWHQYSNATSDASLSQLSLSSTRYSKKGTLALAQNSSISFRFSAVFGSVTHSFAHSFTL